MEEQPLSQTDQRIEDIVLYARERLMAQPDIDRETAYLEADILLAHCLDKPRSYLRAWPEKVASEEQLSCLNDLLHRRLEGEPIAYLVGHKEFWDLRLLVSQDTLIPRPETEHLVEHALKLLKPHHTSRVLDLGCGCGAIALAVAKHRPGCHITAVDFSDEALAITRLNMRQLGLQNVDLVKSNWFSELVGKRFNLILSNPPYVAEDDPHLRQGDVRFEPPMALIGGPDGLECIRDIVKRAPQHLLPGGWLMLEHGYDQASAVKHILINAEFHNVKSHTDLSKHERITIGQWNN